MKQILIAVSVIIALGVVAQKGVVTPTAPPPGEVKVVDANNPKPVKGSVKADIKMTTSANPTKPGPKKANSNSNAANAKEFVSGREMGMARAAEMRAKHEKPKTNDDAIAQAAAINAETKTMLEECGTKIADAQSMLKDQLDSKAIMADEYEMKSTMLNEFEARRMELMKGM